MQRGQEEDAECGEDPIVGMRRGREGDFELSNFNFQDILHPTCLSIIKSNATGAKNNANLFIKLPTISLFVQEGICLGGRKLVEMSLRQSEKGMFHKCQRKLI